MLTCYILDDEMHAIRTLLSYIEKTPLLRVIGYSQTPLTALTQFEETNLYADITFLDIEMPQISGIEVSSLLKGKTAIVFTTAHPNFAPEAFELAISDYLLKPFSYDRFVKCISKINDMLSQQINKSIESSDGFFYIQVEGKGKLIKLFFKDILYIESQKNYLSFSTAEKKYLTYLTLSEVEQKLPPYFLRTNKSYIINTRKISHVEKDEIFLLNLNTGFPIGTSFKNAFSEHMKEHLIKTRRF